MEKFVNFQGDSIKIQKAPGNRKPFYVHYVRTKNYRTNNNSLYFGKGHNSLSTINSSLSMW